MLPINRLTIQRLLLKWKANSPAPANNKVNVNASGNNANKGNNGNNGNK